MSGTAAEGIEGVEVEVRPAMTAAAPDVNLRTMVAGYISDPLSICRGSECRVSEPRQHEAGTRPNRTIAPRLHRLSLCGEPEYSRHRAYFPSLRLPP